MGFNVWIDGRLDYGSQWPLEIQTQLDSCDAFIVVMTPRAFVSEWVQSELQRAKRKLKPIFPMLLEGDEPWLSVESTQFYDVRGEKLPDAKFYSAIRRVVSVGQDDATLHFVKDKAKPAPSPRPVKPRIISTEILVALIGAIVTVVTACATMIGGPLIQKWLTPSPTPNPSETATATSESLAPFDSGAGVPSIVPDSVDVPMALIPAGQFTMGSDNGDKDEKPVHTVYLNDFYIDKYEVTNALYKDCVTAGVCAQPQNVRNYDNSQYANHPVVYVDWNMAKAYCEWRGAQLPTEAQWEKAARGTDGRTYPWGEGIECNKANYLGCVDDTKTVGSYENGQSPYGLYDMAGNVWEWTADWYSDTYYQSSPAENPPGPDSGQYRVLRGGALNQDAYLLRDSARLGVNPANVFLGFGIRCARNVSP
jgi:formylglycine-generating enzyme required for sulfatase activity